MQLPSLQHLAAATARVARRFPLTLLCAFVLCGVGFYLIHYERSPEQVRWLLPLLSAAGLGLPSTLALAVTAERYGWQPAVRAGGQLVLLALLGLWYALFPAEPDFVWFLRLGLLTLAAHLAVSAGPYLAKLRGLAETPGFWRYNQTLFLRILTAALYSGVLFGGCALALLAIDNLFGIKIEWWWYAYLFVGLATLFNTWFFLAGVPADFAALEQPAPYPKQLKVFTQFVLLPLVVLYLVILYAYMGRIVLTWTLPQGWVSVLVLALAVAGIFALLLIHPLRYDAGNAWISTFARWFYRALFPLLGLLAIAIGTRIAHYGITEERYFVLALAGWLLGMAVYFLLRRGQGIIWIPTSLGLLAVLAAGGPWGAFAVAERSQLGQLCDLSRQYKLLQNGHLDGASERHPGLPESVRQRLTSVFTFFIERDALPRLQPLFAGSLIPPDSLNRRNAQSRAAWQRERPFILSGFNPVSRYDVMAGRETDKVVSFQAESPREKAYPLGDGRFWINDIDLSSNSGNRQETIARFAVLPDSFRLRGYSHNRRLVLEQRRPNGPWRGLLVLEPGALADSLSTVYKQNPSAFVPVPNASIMLRAANEKASIRLFLKTLTRHQEADTVSYGLEGSALLELR